MIIGPNAGPNHPIIRLKPIIQFSNRVSPNMSVPQESGAAMLNGLLEKTARGTGVSESGVIEHERGTERDSVGKQAIEKRQGVGLLGFAKRLGIRADCKKIEAGVSAECGGSRARENLRLDLFRFA